MADDIATFLMVLHPQHNHGLFEGLYLLGKAEIRRVDHADHLGGEDRIELYYVGEVLCRGTYVVGDFIHLVDDG